MLQYSVPFFEREASGGHAGGFLGGLTLVEIFSFAASLNQKLR
jgi:hypothetical protein